MIADWRAQLNRLWTVRFAIMGMLLAAADQILAAFQMFVPPWCYGIVSLAVVIARLMYQKDIAGAEK